MDFKSNEQESFLVFGGTYEGRILAETLAKNGYDTTVCVATEYGADLVQKKENLFVHVGRMNAEEMLKFIKEQDFTKIIDATHPYATEVSKNIYSASEKCHLPLVRLKRDCKKEESMAIYVKNAAEAGAFLKEREGKIFLTIGSKHLKEFLSVGIEKERLIIRMLPNPEMMLHVLSLGIMGNQLLCMQGPFSEEMNVLQMKEHQISYLVTKESGIVGGFEEKMRACERLGVVPVILQRPTEEREEGNAEGDEGEGGTFYEEKSAEEFLREIGLTIGNDKTKLEATNKKNKIEAINNRDSVKKETVKNDTKENTDKNITEIVNEKKEAGVLENEQQNKMQVVLAGIGMGSFNNMTLEVREAIAEAQVLIGAKRMLHAAQKVNPDAKTFLSYEKEDILTFLEKERKHFQKVVVVLSGDVGFYSGAKKLRLALKEKDISVTLLPGISSVSYFAAKLGVSYEDAALVSIHGRESSYLRILAESKKLFLLVGKGSDVSQVAKKLCEYHLAETKMAVGACLSDKEESITIGCASDFCNYQKEGCCIVYLGLCESKGYHPAFSYGKRDVQFLRGNVPMTKEEIRFLMIGKLGLKPDSILWDIGAGTGSISIEAATFLRKGVVRAIEKNEEGIALIEKNAKRFGFDNLVITKGIAPECFPMDEVPTHAVIGGSDGHLGEILKALLCRNDKITVVVSAVTLETVSLLHQVMKQKLFARQELLQVQISKDATLGRFVCMKPQSPVWIACFSNEEREDDV